MSRRIKNRKTRDINPALRIRDFYSFGLQILNEINYARMHPDEFVQKLEELYHAIRNDNCLYIEGVPFLYTNLKKSLEDAIDFLSKQKPLPGLVYNKTITQACDYLLDELIIHDGLDENDSNRYTLENRLSKFGEPLGETYELIDYGMFDPEFIVINFVLCDGDNKKYERNVIFNPKIKFLGIASSILPSEKICTVINFCEEFYDKYEGVPLEVQMKYKKSAPKYTTKTIKSYSNQLEPEKKSPDNEEKDYLGNDYDDFTLKRRNSGKMFNMKRDQYIQRRNSLKQKEDEEKEKEKENESQPQNNQQRGGTIKIQPKTNNPEPKKSEPNYKDNEDEPVDFIDDRITTRRKKTIHEPKMMEVIEEENDDDEAFDREFKIESTKKPNQNQNPNPNPKPTVASDRNVGKISSFSSKRNKEKEKEKDKDSNPNSNTTVETKYIGDKKVTTTTTTKTETGDDGMKKTVTTTVTEEIDDNGDNGRNNNYNNYNKYNYEPRYRNKFVKEIPFKSYGRKKYHNQKDEFDVEKEMKELEKDFDSEFGHLNLKSPIKPVFESTDDMFEKEDDIDMPDGAVSMEVKQKTITDSKGKPVLIVHKTITYENGEKKTIIEKKNLVKK